MNAAARTDQERILRHILVARVRGTIAQVRVLPAFTLTHRQLNSSCSGSPTKGTDEEKIKERRKEKKRRKRKERKKREKHERFFGRIYTCVATVATSILNDSNTN